VSLMGDHGGPRASLVVIAACVAVTTAGACSCDGGGSSPDGRVVEIDGSAPMCAEPGSVVAGWPCHCDTDCQGLACLPESAEGYPGGLCLTSCSTDADCGAGYSCLTVDSPGAPGICQPHCATNADCPRGRSCVESRGQRICHPMCQSDAECDSGHCDPWSAKCTDGTPSVGAGVHEPCVRNEDCRSLVCSTPREACTVACSVERDGCPEGLVCTDTTAGDDDFGVCYPPCSTDADCAEWDATLCMLVDVPSDSGVCLRIGGDTSDPCRTGNYDVAATVGCNGGILGPDVPDNDYGGRCNVASNSCTNFSDGCVGATASSLEGICLRTCSPGEAFVSTSTCPTGSRCFQLPPMGLCYPDCNTNADCASGICDGDGSCIP